MSHLKNDIPEVSSFDMSIRMARPFVSSLALSICIPSSGIAMVTTQPAAIVWGAAICGLGFKATMKTIIEHNELIERFHEAGICAPPIGVTTYVSLMTPFITHIVMGSYIRGYVIEEAMGNAMPEVGQHIGRALLASSVLTGMRHVMEILDYNKAALAHRYLDNQYNKLKKAYDNGAIVEPEKEIVLDPSWPEHVKAAWKEALELHTTPNYEYMHNSLCKDEVSFIRAQEFLFDMLSCIGLAKVFPPIHAMLPCVKAAVSGTYFAWTLATFDDEAAHAYRNDL